MDDKEYEWHGHKKEMNETLPQTEKWYAAEKGKW